MDKTGRQAAAKEWTRLLKEHPKFGRVFLAQQVMLMEAAEGGNELVKANMCKMLGMGLPILFEGYWVNICKREPVHVGGILECLPTAADPLGCLSIAHEEDFFEDPFAGGGVVERPAGEAHGFLQLRTAASSSGQGQLSPWSVT